MGKKHTRFLVLNKDEINRACFSPEIVGYDVIQIEPGNKGEYIVEVVIQNEMCTPRNVW